MIVDGRFFEFIRNKIDSRVIFTEAMLSEVEHQANEGMSIGFKRVISSAIKSGIIGNTERINGGL